MSFLEDLVQRDYETDSDNSVYEFSDGTDRQAVRSLCPETAWSALAERLGVDDLDNWELLTIDGLPV